MAKKLWNSPIYKLKAKSGKMITIDVTTSAAPSSPPNKLIKDELIPLFKKRDVQRVLDFGGGALRHTLPLLKAGFEVCVVEFEEAFARDAAGRARAKAEKNANFSALVWPREFLKDRRKFDAALLSFVLQTMPIKSERNKVLKELAKKLRGDAYLFYMSRYGQDTKEDRKHRVKDGFYRWPERTTHSFYAEFKTEDTHKWLAKCGFERIKSLGARGTDQAFLYTCGKGTWI